LLYVLSFVSGMLGLGGPREAQHGPAGHVQARLAEVVAPLEAQGFKVRSLLERGRPVERILEVDLEALWGTE